MAPVQRELILKVAWNDTEEAAGPAGRIRVLPTGATVVLEWETGECLALVRSDVGGDGHRQDRDRLLAELEKEGVLPSADGDGVGIESPGDGRRRAARQPPVAPPGGVGRMSDLVVRAYNVGFGDAILVSVPERTDGGDEETRHLLIDVGNLLAGDGNDDEVFTGVVQDIADRTGGTVDLYVMTHEHLDHVQGLLAAKRAGVELAARHAWLTGSAHPDYYETHPDARLKKRSLELALEDAHRIVQAAPDPWLEMMVRNNSTMLPPGALGLRTSDYVDHLRGIAPADQTHYVDRDDHRLDGKHPFRRGHPARPGPGGGHVVVLRATVRPTLTAAGTCDGGGTARARSRPLGPVRPAGGCGSRRVLRPAGVPAREHPPPGHGDRQGQQQHQRGARARVARLAAALRRRRRAEVVEDDARRTDSRAGALRQDLAPRQPQRHVRRAVRRADAGAEPGRARHGTRWCPPTTATGTACRTADGTLSLYVRRAARCTTPGPLLAARPWRSGFPASPVLEPDTRRWADE